VLQGGKGKILHRENAVVVTASAPVVCIVEPARQSTVLQNQKAKMWKRLRREIFIFVRVLEIDKN